MTTPTADTTWWEEDLKPVQGPSMGVQWQQEVPKGLGDVVLETGRYMRGAVVLAQIYLEDRDWRFRFTGAFQYPVGVILDDGRRQLVARSNSRAVLKGRWSAAEVAQFGPDLEALASEFDPGPHTYSGWVTYAVWVRWAVVNKLLMDTEVPGPFTIASSATTGHYFHTDGLVTSPSTWSDWAYYWDGDTWVPLSECGVWTGDRWVRPSAPVGPDSADHAAFYWDGRDWRLFAYHAAIWTGTTWQTKENA